MSNFLMYSRKLFPWLALPPIPLLEIKLILTYFLARFLFLIFFSLPPPKSSNFEFIFLFSVTVASAKWHWRQFNINFNRVYLACQSGCCLNILLPRPGQHPVSGKIENHHVPQITEKMFFPGLRLEERSSMKIKTNGHRVGSEGGKTFSLFFISVSLLTGMARWDRTTQKDLPAKVYLCLRPEGAKKFSCPQKTFSRPVAFAFWEQWKQAKTYWGHNVIRQVFFMLLAIRFFRFLCAFVGELLVFISFRYFAVFLCFWGSESCKAPNL